jgi:hypothetical protein
VGSFGGRVRRPQACEPGPGTTTSIGTDGDGGSDHSSEPSLLPGASLTDAARTAVREGLRPIKPAERHSAATAPASKEYMDELTAAIRLNDAIKGLQQIIRDRQEERERALQDPIAEVNGFGDKGGEPLKLVVEGIGTGYLLRG